MSRDSKRESKLVDTGFFCQHYRCLDYSLRTLYLIYVRSKVIMDESDDLHVCLKCHDQIFGLDNYIEHRRSNCLSKTDDTKTGKLLI